MSSGKWRPFCLGLNVLKYQQLTIATKATLKFTRSAYTLQNPKQHNTTKIPRVDGNAEIENTDAKKKRILRNPQLMRHLRHECLFFPTLYAE